MADMDNVIAVRDWVAEHPDRCDVYDISSATDINEEEVREILDEWRPVEGADPEHVGPGQGGPWIDSGESPD